jgi:hypothetical protein
MSRKLSLTVNAVTAIRRNVLIVLQLKGDLGWSVSATSALGRFAIVIFKSRVQ